MCRSVEHAANRARVALRLADVLATRGVDPDVAEQFSAGGRHVVAQLAHPGIAARRVAIPSDQTWTVAVVILRHNVARTDAATIDAMGVGR